MPLPLSALRQEQLPSPEHRAPRELNERHAPPALHGHPSRAWAPIAKRARHGHPARLVRCAQQMPQLREPPRGHPRRALLQQVHACRPLALQAGVFSSSRACLSARVPQPERAHLLENVIAQAALPVRTEQLRGHHGLRRPVRRALEFAQQVQHAHLQRAHEPQQRVLPAHRHAPAMRRDYPSPVRLASPRATICAASVACWVQMQHADPRLHGLCRPAPAHENLSHDLRPVQAHAHRELRLSLLSLRASFSLRALQAHLHAHRPVWPPQPASHHSQACRLAWPPQTWRACHARQTPVPRAQYRDHHAWYQPPSAPGRSLPAARQESSIVHSSQ